MINFFLLFLKDICLLVAFWSSFSCWFAAGTPWWACEEHYPACSQLLEQRQERGVDKLCNYTTMQLLNEQQTWRKQGPQGGQIPNISLATSFPRLYNTYFIEQQKYMILWMHKYAWKGREHSGHIGPRPLCFDISRCQTCRPRTVSRCRHPGIGTHGRVQSPFDVGRKLAPAGKPVMITSGGETYSHS